jgi:hypothetical protein
MGGYSRNRGRGTAWWWAFQPSPATAVSEVGGLGFLAAGYGAVVAADLDRLCSLIPAGVPFGVNLVVPPGHGAGRVAGTPRRCA